MAKGNLMAILAVVLIVGVISGVGLIGYAIMNQPSTEDIQNIQSTTATSSLTGKPATLSVKAIDKANDDAQVTAPLYVILDPVVSDSEITGSFSADGTTLSATATTDVTSGINVGKKYVAIAANATFVGFPSEIKTVQTQADLLTVPTHTIAPNVQITMKDEDDNSLGASGATRNLTLSASDAAVLSEIKIKQNFTNTAYNFAGFYFDKAISSNITSIEIAGTQDFSKSSLGLEYTEADDIMFLFDSPILMKEQDTVTISDGIKITANSNGCVTGDAGENLVFYILDRVWVKSSVDSNKMIYAYETDASSPADTGATDQSFTLVCGD